MIRIAFLLLAVFLQAPPANAVVDGIVVRAKTQPLLPLINARVVLSKGTEELVARSDANGYFRFSGIPPGRYRLRVTKDGFVRQEYPHAAMGAPGLPIDLTAGQEMRNIAFQLDPAPTISGIIRDQRNAPLSGVVVQAMRRGFNSRGNRILTFVSSVTTDDHGSYRLYWLDPGEYLIAAVPPLPTNLPARGFASALAATYFPGFAEVEDAKVVSIDSYRNADGIDFRLVQQPLLTVYGNVVSVTSGSSATATITLTPPEDSAGVARYQTRSRPDGAYSISGVVPGSYILSADGGTEKFATRILVRRSELRVNAELNPGVEVPGRIVADALIDLRGVTVQLSETELALPPPAPAPVDRNGVIALRGVQPGAYIVSLENLPGDSYLKAVSQAGQDVLSKPLGVGWGAANMRGPLDIEAGTDGARISGSVLTNDNQPSIGALVTLVPEGENRLRPDRYRIAVSGPDGTFAIRGIVPGEYRLFAWEDLEPNAYLNADYMRAYLELATPFRLEAKQTGSATLRAIRLEVR